MRSGIVVKQVGHGDSDKRQNQVIADVFTPKQPDSRYQANNQKQYRGEQYLPRRQEERMSTFGRGNQRQRKGGTPQNAGAENQQIRKKTVFGQMNDLGRCWLEASVSGIVIRLVTGVAIIAQGPAKVNQIIFRRRLEKRNLTLSGLLPLA